MHGTLCTSRENNSLGLPCEIGDLGGARKQLSEDTKRSKTTQNQMTRLGLYPMSVCAMERSFGSKAAMLKLCLEAGREKDNGNRGKHVRQSREREWSRDNSNVSQFVPCAVTNCLCLHVPLRGDGSQVAGSEKRWISRLAIVAFGGNLMKRTSKLLWGASSSRLGAILNVVSAM